jgi:hypothetical protein
MANHNLKYEHLVMWSLVKPGDIVRFKYKNATGTCNFNKFTKTIVWGDWLPPRYEFTLDIEELEDKPTIPPQLLSEMMFPGGGHVTQPGVAYPDWLKKEVHHHFNSPFTYQDFPIILDIAIPNRAVYDMVSWRSNWLCGIPDPGQLWSSHDFKLDVQKMELWLKERREPPRPPTPPPGLESPRQKKSSNKMPSNPELNKSDIKF